MTKSYLVLALAGCAGFAVAGDNTRLNLCLGDRRKAVIRIEYAETNAVDRVTLTAGAQKEYDAWKSYMNRVWDKKFKPAARTFPDSKVKFSADRNAKWFNFDYTLLPYIDEWNGIYDHSEVLRLMPEWLRTCPKLVTKTFAIDFAYDPAIDRVRAYVDGSYAGKSRFPGRVKKIEVQGVACAPEETEGPYDAVKGVYRLAAQPNAMRVHPYLREGAELSIAPGDQVVDGVPMRVWRPEESYDQGLARETCHRDCIFQLGPLMRNAFANGPDYLEWSVPSRFWYEVDVLCANIPEGAAGEKNGDCVVGTELGRYNRGDGNLGRCVRDFTYVSEKNPLLRSKKVGMVAYTLPDGSRREEPLYLVRHRLDVGELLTIVNSRGYGQWGYAGGALASVGDYLDFGFIGCGLWNGCRKSCTQIFGATLLAAPVAMDIVQTERGNIFAGDEKPVTGVKLTAERDDVKGELVWTIRDERYRALKSGTNTFAFARRGDSTQIDLDLAMPDNGWYALDLDYRRFYRHEAAFTLLGEDTREAGFDSCYAAWPQQLGYKAELERKKPETKGFGGGRHNCNPNREETLKVAHKLGVHRFAHEIVRDENEFPEWQMTWSEFGGNIDEPLEKQVEKFREKRSRYPHLDTIYIFHENEPRGLSKEVLGERAPGPRPDVTPRGREVVEKLTAYCRRMHEEFPGVQIRIANNSAAAERVAQLARNGFDLNLVDQLGSEVRGFLSLPEAPVNLESPGTLWGLRETGRLYGMTNACVGASFEYVFRPERRVDRYDRDNLRQTAYAVRDWLVSLAFGCPRVTSGHLEDCNSGYYDCDWGSSGLCRFYPTSYPKRMFTALATVTKVFDRPMGPRRIPTGENTAYAFEFRRDRRVKDYAYAFWTPEFDVELEVEFPAGAKLAAVSAFGREEPFTTNRLVSGSMPRYLISDRPIVAAKVVRDLPLVAIPRPTDKTGAMAYRAVRRPLPHTVTVRTTCVPPVEYAVPGEVTLREAEDGDFGKVLEVALKGERKTSSRLLSEYAFIEFDEPVSSLPAPWSVTAWVKGNGSFGRVGFVFRKRRGESELGDTRVVFPYNEGYLDFHGWQRLDVRRRPGDVRYDDRSGYDFVGLVVGSAREALDPLEMTPVTEPVLIGPVGTILSSPENRDYDFDWSTSRLRGPLAGWL